MTQPTRVIVTFGWLRATIFAIGLLALLWFSTRTALEGAPGAGLSREGVIIVFTFCSAIFGFGFVLSAAQIFKPSRLILSADGFKVDWLWPLPVIPWNAVAEFGLIRQGLMGHVCFRLTPEAAGRMGRRWWRVGAPPGFDGCVFSALPGTSRRLLAELIEWRDRFGAFSAP